MHEARSRALPDLTSHLKLALQALLFDQLSLHRMQLLVCLGQPTVFLVEIVDRGIIRGLQTHTQHASEIICHRGLPAEQAVEIRSRHLQNPRWDTRANAGRAQAVRIE